MKLECAVDKIKNALTLIDRITGKNLTLPVLSSVLWVASGKTLKLRATNLSLGIEIEIPAKIEKEGVVAIKSDILSSLFSVFQGEINAQIELVKDNLFIKTKQNNILIKSIPHEDFPTIPLVEGNSFTINSQKLIDGLKNVYYSASVSDIKPEIGSIHIYTDENDLVFVATDSFRLAEKRIKIKQNLKIDNILIPFKNTVEIIRVFDNLNEDLIVNLQKNQISFSTNNVYLTSRIVDGVFPDYKQIVPKDFKTQIITLKQDFINALKIANIFSDKFNQITFNINPSKKIFEINTKNSDIGENKTLIPGSLSGEEVVVNLNYKYVLDCFQSINQDSLSLQLNGNSKPIIVEGVGDNSFKYLIMPMNR